MRYTLLATIGIIIAADLTSHAFSVNTVAGVLIGFAILTTWDLKQSWKQYTEDRQAITKLLDEAVKTEDKIKALDDRITTVSNASHLQRVRGTIGKA